MQSTGQEHAEVATGAPVLQHRVHRLGRAHDGVDRARLNAQRATDAAFRVDDGDGARLFYAVGRVQREQVTRAAKCVGQPANAFRAAGWAAVG